MVHSRPERNLLAFATIGVNFFVAMSSIKYQILRDHSAHRADSNAVGSVSQNLVVCGLRARGEWRRHDNCFRFAGSVTAASASGIAK